MPRLSYRFLILTLVIAMVFSGCSTKPQADAPESAMATVEEIPSATTAAVEEVPAAETTIEEDVPEETTLPTQTVTEISVAIYPWLLDVDLFERLLQQEWEKLEPGVSLKLEQWDCYSGPSNCDVLLYDALVFPMLMEHGVIQPIALEDIEDHEDIIPFAMQGSTINNEYYGVPFLLCGDVLIYHKDDAALDAVNNIPQLYAEVMRRREADPTTGVVVCTMVQNPYHYLDAFMDVTGEYSMFEQAPDCNNLNREAIQGILDLKHSAVELPEYPPADPRIVQAFCDGEGFAFYGVTENMLFMEELVDNLKIKPLSYATEGENVPMYYVDVTSIAAHVTDPEMLQLCKKLMNLIGSESFMNTWLLECEKPQYLLPARQNIYLTLAEKYPMYEQLRQLALDPDNHTYCVGRGFDTYLANFPSLDSFE